MYLPKITGNLFFWPKFKMAAKMHTNTYIAVTDSARRLILVSSHRFLGSSIPVMLLAYLWNKSITMKSNMKPFLGPKFNMAANMAND